MNEVRSAAEGVSLTGQPSPMTSRRTLAKGAAWAVPAVVAASGAPAMAASCSDGVCNTYILYWEPASSTVGTFTRTPAKSVTRNRWTTNTPGYSTGSVTESSNSATCVRNLSTTKVRKSGASALTLTIGTVLRGNMKFGGYHLNSGYDPYNDNLCVDVSSIGGTRGMFRLHQQVRTELALNDPRPSKSALSTYDNPYNGSTGSYDDRQEITFSFSEPVCSCSFTIYDIDGSNTNFIDTQGAPVITGDTALTNDFRDAIAILNATDQFGNATEPTYSAMGPYLTGAGLSSTSPIQQNTALSATSYGYFNENPAAPGVNSAVTVSFPNGVRSFTLHYWNALSRTANNYDAYDGDQGIFIGPMTVGVWERRC